MRNVLRHILKALGLLAGAVLVGFGLLCAAYLIPQEAIRDKTAYSVSILRDEAYSPTTPLAGWFPDVVKDSTDIELSSPAGLAPELLQGVEATRLDNISDGIMLNVSYYQTGSVIDDALCGEHVMYAKSVDDSVHVLYDYIWSADKEFRIWTYPQYWNGYQVLLRPLLTVCSISTIRLLNMACQLAGVVAVLMLLTAKRRTELAVPFFVMWLSLVPLTLFYSLHYSTAFYAMLLGCVGVCIETDRQSLGRLCMLFELCGIVLAYLDLITYPVVVVGVPAILYLSLDADREKGLIRRIEELAALGISWGAGYLGMWAAKWLLTNLLTDVDAIGCALEKIRQRTSSGDVGVQFTYLGTLERNISAYKEPVFLLAFALAVVLFVLLAVKAKRLRINGVALTVIGLCALLPFAWYLVTINHSYIHARYTFRELSIAIYALLSLLYVNVRASDLKGTNIHTTFT